MKTEESCYRKFQVIGLSFFFAARQRSKQLRLELWNRERPHIGQPSSGAKVIGKLVVGISL
jgi:hypothetical protein